MRRNATVMARIYHGPPCQVCGHVDGTCPYPRHGISTAWLGIQAGGG